MFLCGHNPKILNNDSKFINILLKSADRMDISRKKAIDWYKVKNDSDKSSNGYKKLSEITDEL